MSKKQFWLLMVCSFISWTIGSGLLPVLPVYARILKVPSTTIGYYLGISYLALVFGFLSGGWIADHSKQQKKIIFLSGLVSLPSIWATGQVDNVILLTLTTSLIWFCGGLSISVINALAGLFVAENQRGKIFGYLGMAATMGAIFGSLSIGFLADNYGYPKMFMILAIFGGLLLPGSLLIENNASNSPKETGFKVLPDQEKCKTTIKHYFTFLLVATFLTAIAQFLGRLGISLLMDHAKFSSIAISSTAAIGGIIILPLPALMGMLSDRYPRKYLLVCCYMLGMLGFLLLQKSSLLWHFWLVAGCIAILANVSISLASALVTDFSVKEKVGRSLALLNASKFSGGILGFMITGYIFEHLGVTIMFSTGALLLISASIVILSIPKTVKQ